MYQHMSCLILWVVFYLADDFLCCAKTFSFDGVPLFIFSFVSLAWGEISDKILLPNIVVDFAAYVFFSGIFMVSGLIFKYLVHYEFILVCGVRRWFSIIFLHISVQFSQHHLLNKLPLAHCICLLRLLNIN